MKLKDEHSRCCIELFSGIYLYIIYHKLASYQGYLKNYWHFIIQKMAGVKSKKDKR